MTLQIENNSLSNLLYVLLILLTMLPLGLFHHNFFFTESYYSLSTLFQAITMDICYWVYHFMLEAPPIKICCINILSSDHNIIITFRDNEPHQGLLFSFSFMNKFGYCQELMKLKGKERRHHSDWLLRETLLREWQGGFEKKITDIYSLPNIQLNPKWDQVSCCKIYRILWVI